jgi:two-component system sensor histidine kinase HydH
MGAHSRQPRNFSDGEIAQLQILANIVSYSLIAQVEQENHHSQKLLRAEQMMAIGQVAAGVAHELRNPLTSIKGLVQVNVRDLKSRGIPSDDLTVIEHEIRRMERTLQTFLDFAKPPKPDRQVVDLPSIVERVLALVGGRARKQNISLEFTRPQVQVAANVDNDQIQQLLLNLVLNSLDAMPRGGRIEVELQPGRDGFVDVYVRDNGPGIAPHILPKVFESFVSSKETGVGLGLPLSRRIAEDHGGTLNAYNLPESGACFQLRLPAP